MLEDYLYEYCNFGCAYFVIQRVGGKKEKSTTRRRKRNQQLKAIKHVRHTSMRNKKLFLKTGEAND